MPTVFFSWQADTETREGRNFIERALERAIAEIASDVELEDAVRDGLEVDRDTKGVPGSPPIVDTIFNKIEQAAVFIPDISFVGTRLDGRPTPNPNVLIEYGWALRSLGHVRIVPVMNIAHGRPTPEAMPFDLRHLRNPITYDLPPSADEPHRKVERTKLARTLKSAIRAVLDSNEFRSSLPRAPKQPPFAAKEPKDGPARFRLRGEPVAFSHDRFTGARAMEVRLTQGAAMWLRVMPSDNPDRMWNITEIQEKATGKNWFLNPLGGEAYSSFNYMRHEDGFGIYALEGNRPGDDTSSLVFVFETGEIWGIDTYLLEATKGGPIPFVEDRFRSAFSQYASFLARLEVMPPYRWMAGMEGLKGKSLQFPARPGHMLPPRGVGSCIPDIVEAQGLHQADADPLDSIKPFFERLFDQCGIPRPEYLDGQE